MSGRTHCGRGQILKNTISLFFLANPTRASHIMLRGLLSYLALGEIEIKQSPGREVLH